MVVSIIVSLKLVVLDVVIGSPLVPVLPIGLVLDFHNDFLELVDHDLVSWVLLLDEVNQLIIAVSNQLSLTCEVPQLGSGS